MFPFVLSILFSDWIWVDQTEKISMGLELIPFCHFESPEYPGLHKLVFFDMDLDGDEDMLEWLHTPDSVRLHAYENKLNPNGRLWELNNELLLGVDIDANLIGSMGAGDANADSRDELVIVTASGNQLTINAYENEGQPGEPLWVESNLLFSNLSSDSMAREPDFADIDHDGDQDMVGLFKLDSSYYPFLCLWWNKGTPKKPEWEIDTSYFDGDRWEDIGNPCWIDWGSDGIWDIVLTTQTGLADPPPMPWAIGVIHNYGSSASPLWEPLTILNRNQMDAMALIDWNQDGVEDIVFPGDEFDGGYHYVPGKSPLDTTSYDFAHHIVWGGIMADYPATADFNGDKVPEITVTEQEHHMWGITQQTHHYWSHVRTYAAIDQGTIQWKLIDENCWGYYTSVCFGLKPTPPATDSSETIMQYVDFGNDKILDYVKNVKYASESDTTGFSRLYRNQGTKTEPAWVADSTALSSLPPLFPACFLDVDGDGDKDVIGVPLGDSFPKGFLNMSSDKSPHYAEYAPLVSGLENVKPTYFAAGDITDDDLSLADLALGIKEENITAFFNTGQSNPRWHKHEEVFKNLGISGNPSLCDADADGDLDLYVASGGTLHYYNNQSTGAIVEKPDGPSELLATHIGRNVELRFSADSRIDAGARLFLYNAAGQRVAELAPKIEANTLLFSICGDVEGPGVYFYRIVIGRDSYKGKVVLY